MLLHELAELGEPLGGVYLLHIEEAAYCGRVEGSSGMEWQTSSCVRCRSRVRAKEEAREQHEWLSSGGLTPPACMQLPRDCSPLTGRTCPASLALFYSLALAKPSHQHDDQPNPSQHCLRWRTYTPDAVTMFACLIRSLPSLPAHAGR